MEPERVAASIVSLARALGPAGYVLIGSGNLYLQGLEVSPRDIDLLTTPDGMEAVDRTLAARRKGEVRFDATEGRNSFRGFYDWEGCEVEVLGNVSNAYRAGDFLERRLLVTRDGVPVPCLPLELELDAYRRMGRPGKVAILERHLGR